MKYQCEQCDKEADDSGPYERSDGEYECQDCMENKIDAAEYAEDCEIKYHKPQGYYTEKEPIDRYNQEEVNGKS